MLLWKLREVVRTETEAMILRSTDVMALLLPVLLLGTTSAYGSKNGTSTECYSCGPLAELVNKDRIPKPCSEIPNDNEIIQCDSDEEFCATVATVPGYVESRICTKTYTPECYKKYCNTTKTWKMFCPCQGNKCNKEKSEREIEAFEKLQKMTGHEHEELPKAEPLTSEEQNSADESSEDSISNEKNSTHVAHITLTDKEDEILKHKNHNVTIIKDKTETSTIDKSSSQESQDVDKRIADKDDSSVRNATKSPAPIMGDEPLTKANKTNEKLELTTLKQDIIVNKEVTMKVKDTSETKNPPSDDDEDTSEGSGVDSKHSEDKSSFKKLASTTENPVKHNAAPVIAGSLATLIVSLVISF